jgi:putative hydrolase of HD superfamily
VEKKAEIPDQLLQADHASFIAQSYFELCRLKQLYRQGWLRRGVPRERCESVAEHSFGVALLALWLAQADFPQLDAGKVLRMALLHDFGEIYAGDIIPGDNLPVQEKREREAQSVEKVLGKLPEGETYVALWREFELGDSPEARFVRQVDRLEMGLQAGVYAAQGFAGMDEFFASARQGLAEQRLLELLGGIESIFRTDP